MLASVRRAVFTTPVAWNSADTADEEVDRVLLPVRLVQPDPAAARGAVQRGAPGPAELGDGGRRQRHPDGPVGVDGDTELRGQTAGELARGRDGEGQMRAGALEELLPRS